MFQGVFPLPPPPPHGSDKYFFVYLPKFLQPTLPLQFPFPEIYLEKRTNFNINKVYCIVKNCYLELPLRMLCGSLPGLLHVELDVLEEVEAEVAVRPHHHREPVVAGLARGGELELHLLLGHQPRQVVGRRHQAMSLSITDIHPPAN